MPLFDLLFCTFRLDAVHESVFNFTLPLCAMSWSIHSVRGERRISAYRWVRLACCSKFTVDRFSCSEIILHASTAIDFYERPKKNPFNANFKPRTTNPEVLRRISGCIRNYHRHCPILRDKWVPVTTAWRFLRLRMEGLPPIWKITANVLYRRSSHGQPKKNGLPSWVLGQMLTNPRRKNWPCYETNTGASGLD